MIEIFDTQQEYNVYTSYNTCLQSDRLYYIKENGNTHFYTNNIDGEAKVYDNGAVAEGTIEITENGTYDVETYKNAEVSILPSGNITIEENGTGIDVGQYATATVNVPTKEEDIKKLLNRSITSFEIPADTTTIGSGFFYDCTGLTSITIPNNVTTIGDSAFQNCTSLTSITIPNNVTSIGKLAFFNCINITEINIGNSVTSIGNEAFLQCLNILTINIPDSVTTIGTSAFGYCNNMTNITFGTGVTNMNSNTLQNCSKLTSITVKAINPPTVSNLFGYGSGPSGLVIYVPAASVDAYKAARGWSNFAAKIQAIPTT